jgi:hypothetical protein
MQMYACMYVCVCVLIYCVCLRVYRSQVEQIENRFYREQIYREQMVCVCVCIAHRWGLEYKTSVRGEKVGRTLTSPGFTNINTYVHISNTLATK